MMTITPTLRKTPTDQSGSLEVRLLGCVDFQAMKLLQEWRVSQIARSENRSGTLMLCEHPPCVTKGRTSSIEQIDLHGERELNTMQIPTFQVNRAGGTLIHAPGQLAVYLVLPYQRLGINPIGFVARLHTAIRNVINDQNIDLPRPNAHSVDSISTNYGKQLATINVASRSGVSCFGAYLNVAPDLSLLRLVKSAGDLADTTSLQAERAGLVRMDAVREPLIRQICNSFDYQKTHIHTSHPFLKRTIRKIHAYA